jgi:excisionase family DNA binding protein
MEEKPDFLFSESLTVAEFCDREKISKNLAYRMIKAGELPHYRLSPRNTRIDVAALRTKLAGGGRATSSEESSK